MTRRRLPAVDIEGSGSAGSGTPDHPMRLATRRAAGLTAEGWTPGLRDSVKRNFDALALDWHTRISERRIAIVEDALRRGLEPFRPPSGPVVEIGSGIGAYSPALAQRFGFVIAIDLSMEMLRRAPEGPAFRIQADGSRLPLPDSIASAVVLINAFLFPSEAVRILAARGIIVWVNTSGEATPIHLTGEVVERQLPGDWEGVESRAGEGTWCVLGRRSEA